MQKWINNSFGEAQEVRYIYGRSSREFQGESWCQNCRKMDKVGSEKEMRWMPMIKS